MPLPVSTPHTWAEWLRRLGEHLAAHGHTLYNLDFVNAVPADDPAPVLQALRFDLTADAPTRTRGNARPRCGAGERRRRRC